MRYFCRVTYDGTPFAGWQRQNDAITVQQTLEDAAAIILRAPCPFTGAGRTDAGVHARAMGAHFDTDHAIDAEKFAHSMNAILPPAIAMYNVKQVPPSFHARFSALARSYRYYICRQKSPLLRHRAWYCPYGVDRGIIMVQLPSLLGIHDFSTFCSSGSNNATANCTVYAATIEMEAECMVFSIRANRFVYNMVRSITGTLIDIGRGKQPAGFSELLARKDRSSAGTTAPACGLVLDDVIYAEADNVQN